jgi:molybdopterin-guanine dinucleotide biosynthesis protein A
MTAGVILAGGLARRMGGGDKCLCPLAGRTVLDHIIERLNPQVSTLALNANGDERRFSRWGIPVVPDTIPQSPGPLAGIIAGMRWAMASDYSEIVTVPGDTPFIPLRLVSDLREARLEAHSDIAIARSGGSLRPVIGLWSVALVEELERAVLFENVRSVREFLLRQIVKQVDYSNSGFDPFMNINVPADLESAEAIARRAG